MPSPSTAFCKEGALLKRLIFTIFINFLFSSLVTGVAFCLPTSSAFAVDENTPWNIEANELRQLPNGNYVAEGNVEITQLGKVIKADHIVFDQTNMTVIATGHVFALSQGNVMTGDRLTLDLESETGILYSGSIFAQENHITISGNEILKTGPDSYLAKQAIITTCDMNDPDWKLTGKNVKVTIDGYGIAEGATFWAKNLPILWAPYLVFPAKVTRQTGLLMPSVAYSNRLGVDIEIPVFWAINNSMDATFYYNHLDKRGNRFGAEFRYESSYDSGGIIQFDYLNDRQIDDGTPSNSKWGYDGDGFTRPNHTRYWFRMKQDQTLFADIKFMSDIDIVSDQDYLREFRSGYAGFEKSKKMFFDRFSRSLDEYDEHVRLNRLALSRTGQQWYAKLETRWYDDVAARNLKLTDTNTQSLPTFFVANVRTPVFSQFPNIQYSVAGEASYLYRKDSQQGARLDIAPRFYFPFNLGKYVSITPSIGLDATYWNVTEPKTIGDVKAGSHDRFIYDFTLEASTQLHRTFDVNFLNVQKLQYIIRPEILYSLVPDLDQTGLPNFGDYIDRYQKNNKLTYGFTNIFMARLKPSKQPKRDNSKFMYNMDIRTPEPDAQKYKEAAENVESFTGMGEYLIPLSSVGTPFASETKTQATYAELMRFSIYQSYDWNAQTSTNRPFSPIEANLIVGLSPYLSLRGGVAYNTYDGNFPYYNIGGSVSVYQKYFVGAEYRFAKGESNSFYGRLNTALADRWFFFGDIEYNFSSRKTLQAHVGLLYKTKCWGLGFSWGVEDSNNRYQIMITLTGISSF